MVYYDIPNKRGLAREFLETEIPVSESFFLFSHEGISVFFHRIPEIFVEGPRQVETY